MKALLRHRSYGRLRLVCMLTAMSLLVGMSPSLAQEETAVPAAPEITETVVPTEQPTEQPTEAPTEVVTDEPTETPTTETPTAEPPTEEPTELPTETPEVTEQPSATPDDTLPPVFTFPNGSEFLVESGLSVSFELFISDDSPVTINADVSGIVGQVSIETLPAAEAQSPFTTPVTVHYSAPASFSGVEAFTLTAVDSAGLSSTQVIIVTVTAVATEEPTETATMVPLPTEEFIIRYNVSASEDSIQAMLVALNAIELERIPALGVMKVLGPENLQQPQVGLASIASSDSALAAGVTSISENGYLQLALNVNDPRFSQQTYLAATPEEGLSINRAWDLAPKRGQAVVVAVIDSGVDAQHPDFANALVKPWDFFSDDANADDTIDSTADIATQGHGTAVAGIIAARANNSSHIAGIAFNAQIMPVRVCGRVTDTTSTIGSSLACPMFEVISGIVYAVDNGAQVINLSMGTSVDDNSLHAAIDYALSRNVIVIAAAGNTGDDPENNETPEIEANAVQYPAAYPGVISVGAFDSTGNILPSSTHNNSVLISAMADNILTLAPINMPGEADGLKSYSGTSFAAAQASGVAALLIGERIATDPQGVANAFICGALDEFDTSPAPTQNTDGWDQYYGYGYLDAELSLNWNGNSSDCSNHLNNDVFSRAKNLKTVPANANALVDIASASVSASDPSICGAVREQTVWYKLKPTTTGYYQIATLGSGYNTAVGVFQGANEGALIPIGCTLTEQLAVPLQANQQYYIVVGTEGTAVENQLMRLTVRQAMTSPNTFQEENAPTIAYIGQWARTAGPSGSVNAFIQSTMDQNAIAAFTVRGTGFDYVRSTGPDRSSVDVYVNGIYLTTVVNRGPRLVGNQLIRVDFPGGTAPGSLNLVQIVMTPGQVGIMDVDRIRPVDYDSVNVVTLAVGKYDDRRAGIDYSDGWSQASVGSAFQGTVTETNVVNETMTFRGNGDAFTIFRETGASASDMEITVDDGTPIVVDNNGSTTTFRPYTINGLTSMNHVITVRKINNDGLTLRLDAIQVLKLGAAAAGTRIDERNAKVASRGEFTRLNLGAAFSGTLTSYPVGSEVSFSFTGGNLCFAYQTNPGAATIQLVIDGVIIDASKYAAGDEGAPDPDIDNIPTAGTTGLTSWCLMENSGQVLGGGTHLVVFRIIGTPGAVVTFDSFTPKAYAVLNPAAGIVQENSASFIFEEAALWPIRAASSPGGYRASGGSLRRATNELVDDTTITFYMNGTGFILYTTTDNDRTCYQVKVDGVLYMTSTYLGNPVSVIDLKDDRSVLQPAVYGVSGMGPGMHQITLIADIDCSTVGREITFGPGTLDFDAVRVFP